MAYLLGALLCLCLSAAPYGFIMMLSVGAGRGEDHVWSFAFSLATVVVGLVFCWQGWKRSRVLAVLLAIPLLGPGALSALLLWEALA